ncbi:hypothetical protein [Methylobacterium aquaticum]|uniref:Uncharacterized protein n=1 Tax=Methylobacterium aquaticum TaxID=270351 RepID=A0A0C6FC09_9HYPH|nr:hypothetical protein [Methylobacterium aquaticum]BAQ44377.1 hypothetical protein Maq22A_c04855 [Methylobacterium aquaticum]
MIVLHWASIMPVGTGRWLNFPIGVQENDLADFTDRLCREGGVLVERLWMRDGGDGYYYIDRSERVFISIAATATIRDFDGPVRLEFDAEDAA